MAPPGQARAGMAPARGDRSGNEDRRAGGLARFEVGMRADFVVTQQNAFRVPITEVHATRVVLTYIDGEKVFDASSPPSLTAR